MIHPHEYKDVGADARIHAVCLIIMCDISCDVLERRIEKARDRARLFDCAMAQRAHLGVNALGFF